MRRKLLRASGHPADRPYSSAPTLRSRTSKPCEPGPANGPGTWEGRGLPSLPPSVFLRAGGRRAYADHPLKSVARSVLVFCLSHSTHVGFVFRVIRKRLLEIAFSKSR